MFKIKFLHSKFTLLSTLISFYKKPKFSLEPWTSLKNFCVQIQISSMSLCPLVSLSVSWSIQKLYKQPLIDLRSYQCQFYGISSYTVQMYLTQSYHLNLNSINTFFLVCHSYMENVCKPTESIESFNRNKVALMNDTELCIYMIYRICQGQILKHLKYC